MIPQVETDEDFNGSVGEDTIRIAVKRYFLKKEKKEKKKRRKSS